jgi:2-polyprenyl-3-methyl-5-hydroxy-6-metoxy-1,4-benzoquinol methylase
MREITCAICGHSERKVVYASTIGTAHVENGHIDPYSAHYQINRCRQCDLVYSSPIFDGEEVQALYTESAHTNILPGEEENVRRTMGLYYKMARGALPGRDRMLDVGCDIGLLLDVARQDGFRELHGLEPVKVAADLARTIPGAVISSDFFEEQTFPEQYFDLISMIHVVDHLVDPTPILERAWSQLKPGGVILAVVHNVDSWLARVLRERFPPYNLYHHYFFRMATLRRLFEKSSFEVLRVAPTYNCYSVGFLVEKIPLLPGKRAMRRVLEGPGLANRPLTVPLGNIGIVARRPRAAA